MPPYVLRGGEEIALPQLGLQVGHAGGSESQSFHRSFLSQRAAWFAVVRSRGVDSPQLRRKPERREAGDDDEHFHDDPLPYVCVTGSKQLFGYPASLHGDR